MRVTIVPSDSVVVIDGEARHPIDLSFMAGIHAVQWYDNWGEVERVNPETLAHSNERIEDLGSYQQAVALWNDWKHPWER